MPKLSPDAMHRRRQHILDAAVRQFEKRGFGAASVDSICGEAGISKGALYTHFASKEAIMLEMIRQRGEVYRGIEAASLEELETGIFDMMLRGLSYTDSRLEMEAVTIGATQESIKAALIENSQICEERISAVIEGLLEKGKIAMMNAVGPREAAVMIHTYILGRLARQVYEPSNKDEEALRGLGITVRGVLRALP